MNLYLPESGLYRGLLYNLVKSGKKTSIKLTSSLVEPLFPHRVVDNIIVYDDDSKIFTSEVDDNSGQWVQAELKGIYIDLTAYALGFHGVNYPRHWDILVSFDGINWRMPQQIRNNDDTQKGHIFKFPKRIWFVRFFKIINKGRSGKNDSLNNALYITNIDLYGNVVECKAYCASLLSPSFVDKHRDSKRIKIILLNSLLIILSC